MFTYSDMRAVSFSHVKTTTHAFYLAKVVHSPFHDMMYTNTKKTYKALLFSMRN